MRKTNKDKRRLKNEPRLKIQLSEEQKDVYRGFLEQDVTVVMADFGAGKTLVACHIAITELRKKNYNMIWALRPMLKDGIGALPGGIEEKLQPHTFPIMQNMEACVGLPEVNRMVEKGLLKVMPIAVAKGVTFMDSVVILDEAQDCSWSDLRTILSRLGKTSKIIICASEQQIDPRVRNISCVKVIKKMKDYSKVSFHTLVANHRNPILRGLIDFLESE